jgi:hypothetical protein
MLRVDTATVSAEVIKKETGWYRTDKRLIGFSMGSNRLVFLGTFYPHTQRAIPATVYVPSPQPASCLAINPAP